MNGDYLRARLAYYVRQLRQKATASATYAQHEKDPCVQAEYAALYQAQAKMAEDLEALLGRHTVRK